MNAQVIYDLLEYFKKKPKYKDKSMKLLKFLYDDVHRDISLKIEDWEKEGLSTSFLSDFQSGIVDFIDEDNNSILCYFKEMIDDNKEEFLNYFFDKINSYFVIVDNHLFREEDFIYYTCVFNIYMMCKSYIKYKDDFEEYKKRVDEFSALISPNGLNDMDSSSDYEFCLSDKKTILDKIFEIDSFEEVPILKEMFDKCFKKICVCSYDNSEFEVKIEQLDFISRVVSDMRMLLEDDPNFDQNNVFKFIEEWVEYYSEDEEYFYAPILLYGKRFEYIRDCYSTYLERGEYMDQVVEYLNSFNNKLFVYLDSINKDGQDSFITCMEMVFDSDSLEELEKKLVALREVSNMYDSDGVSYQEVLGRIKDLSSDKFKKIYNGRKVMYICDTANKAERPTDIFERMIEVYSQMFEVSGDEIRYNVVEHYTYSDTMAEFEDDVNVSLDELENARIRKLEEEKKKSVEESLELYGVERNRDLNMGYTFSGDSVSNNNDKDSNKGIQKSIKKFFGRK